MDRDFVERRDDGFYLVGSRVPLAVVVREFRNGQSPEAIRWAFPTLSLEQVYGAITFYLGHKDEVDDDIAARERVEDAFSDEHQAPPNLKEKLERTLLAEHRLTSELGIPDCVIAAMSLIRKARLYTFNLKHVQVIPGIDVQEPYSRR
jgi:uncharacterized protein (DUF433 family)